MGEWKESARLRYADTLGMREIMKIVTWNCNGGLRNKLAPLGSISADLSIIQECEDPGRVTKPTEEYQTFSENYLWIGDNKNKGLGVFANKGFSLSEIPFNQSFGDGKLKWFLPFLFDGRIEMIASWAHRGDTGEFRYIGQFYKLLLNNQKIIQDQIFIGDFNSNKQWDYKRSEGDHSSCVRILEDRGIYSVYHHIKKEEHGKEKQPTFFLQKKSEKPYHIDYAFSPMKHIAATKHFEIGDFSFWHQVSDHVPLVWEFEET